MPKNSFQNLTSAGLNLPEARGCETGSKDRASAQQCVGATGITVQVLLFAQLKDRLGQSEFFLTLPMGANGRHLMEALRERAPSARPLLEASRLAVGQEYVSWDHPLREADEVAIIPPVSGG